MLKLYKLCVLGVVLLMISGCTGFLKGISKHEILDDLGYNKPETEKPYFVVILDTSGSMNEKDGSGAIKIDTAKNTLSHVVDKIPQGTTYISLAHYQGCKVQFLTSLFNTNNTEVRDKVYDLTPSGATPLAESIRRVGERLFKQKAKEATIVVVSDGLETCNGDPCGEARRLNANTNLDVKIYTVGYDVDGETSTQLKCVAKAGDGEYFDVRNRVELGERVEDVLHERVTSRFDEDGDRVLDEHDKCPGTPRGFKVDENGCALVYTFNLLFDTNSSEVKPEFMKSVKDLADYQKKTGVAFELRGHTDITGSQQYNQKLSKQRAKAVMEKLIELGVEPTKLSSKGLGSKEPVADNSTTAGRDKNRRVEAVINPN